MDWKTDIEPVVTSVIRHALTVAAGSLATAGVIQTDQQTQFIAIGSGAALWALAQVWSWWQKRKQAAQLRAAAGNGG